MTVLALADTSVWGKRSQLGRTTATWLDAALLAGRIATCEQIVAELLYSARTVAEYRLTRRSLARLPQCPLGERTWQRAFDVWELIAARGGARHRQVPFADCLIAAAAESANVAVLHYDRDYERIAELTGQPVRAIAPLGSL